MALGSLFAALPPLWQQTVPESLAYRPLFLLPLLGAIATIGLLLPASDRRAVPARPDDASETHAAPPP